MGMPSLTSLLDFKLDLCTLLISFVQKLLAIPILFYPIPFLKFSKVKGCSRVGPDRVCAQPGLDPLRSGGRESDPQPTADHHGSIRIGF